MAQPRFGDADGEICPNCRSLVGGERELANKAWDIMGRGVIFTNEYGDSAFVEINIGDWRELCELLNQSK